jgi:small subunit ribosomal protein S20
MANHKSAQRESEVTKEKSIKQIPTQNYSCAIKALRIATDKVDATAKLSNVISMIDKLAKKISFMITKLKIKIN